MTQLELQRLRSLPIEGVAERLGLHVAHHKALCPFHDDSHPSLSFLVRKNTFRCFVCDAHGGTIDLAMRVLGTDFLGACRWLADAHNVILTEWKPAEKPVVLKPFDASRYERFFVHPYLNEAARRFLFDERHIDPRVVRWCRLTSWTDRQGTNWLQTPYYDQNKKLIGVQNRRLRLSPGEALPQPLPKGGEKRLSSDPSRREGSAKPAEGLDIRGNRIEMLSPLPPGGAGGEPGENDTGGIFVGNNRGNRTEMLAPLPPGGAGGEPLALAIPPRFRFPSGSQCHIYNLPVLRMLRPGEPLFITEGCSDCWAMLSAGHKAIAIPSATLLKPGDAEMLRSLAEEKGTTFHMYPDQDAPGERLFMQLSQLLPGIVHHQLPKGCKDFGEYFKDSR